MKNISHLIINNHNLEVHYRQERFTAPLEDLHTVRIIKSTYAAIPFLRRYYLYIKLKDGIERFVKIKSRDKNILIRECLKVRDALWLAKLK